MSKKINELTKEEQQELFEKMKASVGGTQMKKREEGQKLDDADMEKVAGGFTENDYNMGAYGYWVQCPGCGESRMSMFDITANDFVYYTEYRCRNCGRQFMIDNTGMLYDYGAVRNYYNSYGYIF